jgi:hypothetical protein
VRLAKKDKAKTEVGFACRGFWGLKINDFRRENKFTFLDTWLFCIIPISKTKK